MSGSGTIRVLKRDRSREPFDAWKLTAVVWPAMQSSGLTYPHARQLAEAVEMYLSRQELLCISSTAIFEMLLKAFRHVGMDEAALQVETHRRRRRQLREKLRVRHDPKTATLWDKRWLCQFARRSWHISPATARILAGQIEHQLLDWPKPEISRMQLLEQLNRLMCQYGLADAVPVPQLHP